jgi:hypothetical protein
MANPNKTVGEFRRKNPFPAREPRPRSPFMQWFFKQVQENGKTFESMTQAEQEFNKENSNG